MNGIKDFRRPVLDEYPLVSGFKLSTAAISDNTYCTHTAIGSAILGGVSLVPIPYDVRGNSNFVLCFEI